MSARRGTLRTRGDEASAMAASAKFLWCVRNTVSLLAFVIALTESWAWAATSAPPPALTSEMAPKVQALTPEMGAHIQALTPEMEARVHAVAPELERYMTAGMKAFDVPGAVIGIVSADRLLWSKAIGLKRKGANDPVGSRTVFQIGSTTKAFTATTLALAVDRSKLKWEDRVADLDPLFVLKDPYVTREFRVFDLLAQRSGLPPYANDGLSGLGFDVDWLMRSLRFVEPQTSFRTTFAYTNITHLFAGRIAAKALAAPDWNNLVEREIFVPLGMKDASVTAEGIEKAPDHAIGHRWDPNRSVEIPFDPSFPYLLGPAGAINASLDDCVRWLRLQLGNGVFEGRRLVSAENLAVTRTPKIAINQDLSYAIGWVVSETPNGRAIWHNGGTNGFGAHIGFLPAKGVLVIVLSNEQNKGFADSVGLRLYDKLLGNSETDYAKKQIAQARETVASEEATLKKPTSPRPPPEASAVSGDYRSEQLGAATITQDREGLILILKQTGARLRLDPFDGAIFTVRLVPEGRFALTAAALGDTPIDFADFRPDGEGRLTQLHWVHGGYVLDKLPAQ